MSSPLRGHFTKTKRAYQHLETLDKEIRRVRELRGKGFRTHLNEDEKGFWHQVLVKPSEFPFDWGVVVGEFAHDLRSSLDQLIFTMFERFGVRPSETSAFPVCALEAEWIKKVVYTRRQPGKRDTPNPLQGLPLKVWTFIHNEQPYLRGDARKQDSLFILNDLWNTDKHKVIAVSRALSPDETPVCTLIAKGKRQRISDIRYTPGKPIEGDTEVELVAVRVPTFIARNNAYDEVTVEMPPLQVAFGEGRLKLRDLVAMYHRVVDIIDRAGEEFFGNKPPSDLAHPPSGRG